MLKHIKQSKKLNDVCYDIRGPILEKANALQDEGHKILKLNIGNPAPFGFEASDEIISNVRNHLTEAQGYIDSQGLLLYRTGNEVRAFRNNCTHSGWDLRPFVNGVSVCISGHGGRFDTNGKAIASPASCTLIKYDTLLDGNSLTIFS